MVAVLDKIGRTRCPTVGPENAAVREQNARGKTICKTTDNGDVTA